MAAAYLGVLYVHGLAIASGERRAACAFGQPLYDVVHALQGEGNVWVSWFPLINTDVVLALLTVTLVVGLVRHPGRQLYFRRFLVFHAALASIRAASIWVTTIPSPSALCRNRVMASGAAERAVTLTVDAIGIPHEWFGLGAAGNTCCDIIISGHAAMFVVDAALILMLYRARAVRWSAMALAVLGLLSTVAPSRHYTVEVLLTTVLGVLLISAYTQAVALGKMRWIEGESATE
jgi:hypothetical protein